MKKLNNEEMIKVKGGAVSKFWGVIGAGIVFLIGLIDGLINPRKCNN